MLHHAAFNTVASLVSKINVNPLPERNEKFEARGGNGEIGLSMR